MRYLLKNISRKPLKVLNTPLASAMSSIKGIPGTLIITDSDLSDYSVQVFLERGHISLEPLDAVVKAAPEVVPEVVEEVAEIIEIEEVEPVEEAPAEDTLSEPAPSVYSAEELKQLSYSELKSVLGSFGKSSNSKKKVTLIKKILEAQDETT